MVVGGSFHTQLLKVDGSQRAPGQVAQDFCANPPAHRRLGSARPDAGARAAASAAAGNGISLQTEVVPVLGAIQPFKSTSPTKNIIKRQRKVGLLNRARCSTNYRIRRTAGKCRKGETENQPCRQ